MAETVAEMTPSELMMMIEHVVEQKFLELVGDPDEGLELREEVKQRLLEQQARMDAGERGVPFEEVKRQLGLE